MTYIMSGGALNSTHSLECDLISAVISYRSLWCDVGNVSVCDEIVKVRIKRKYQKKKFGEIFSHEFPLKRFSNEVPMRCCGELMRD